jgi:hypothetical protein
MNWMGKWRGLTPREADKTGDKSRTFQGGGDGRHGCDSSIFLVF